MRFWSQAWEIARVDLLVERRLGDTLRVVIPFSVVGIMSFPLALGLRADLVRDVGFGVLWAMGVLFGMQVALRHSASDDRARRDLQALAGVDPAARFAGRVISGAVLMSLFLLVLGLAMIVLFTPDLPDGVWAVATASALLLGIGLTELGTIAGEVASGLRSRTALASLIVAPMALPLVIGAAESVQALERETSILPWVLLLVAVDLALAVVGVILARPLEEAAR